MPTGYVEIYVATNICTVTHVPYISTAVEDKSAAAIDPQWLTLSPRPTQRERTVINHF